MLSLRSVVEGSFFFLGAKYLNQASRLQVTGQYPPLPSKGIPLQRNKMPQIDSIPKSPSAYFSPLTHLPSDRSQREPCLLLRVVAGEAPALVSRSHTPEARTRPLPVGSSVLHRVQTRLSSLSSDQLPLLVFIL